MTQPRLDLTRPRPDLTSNPTLIRFDLTPTDFYFEPTLTLDFLNLLLETAKLKSLLDNGYHLGNDDEPVTGQSGWEFYRLGPQKICGSDHILFYYFISTSHSFFVQYHSVVWEC